MTANERWGRDNGVHLVHTSPLQQRWQFDRYRGRRRVASAIVVAKTRWDAWKKVRQLFEAHPQAAR